MRTKRAFLFSVLLAVLLVGFTGQAQASYILSADGTASDGRPNNGLAVFDFTSLTKLSITLTNTAGPSQLGGISSVLDGLSFTLSVAPSSMTLTSAHAAGTVTVTNKTVVFNDPPGGITQTALHPFNWSLQQEGTTWQLFAGKGQTFKPYGIVNSYVTATDGITNKVHNPYLDGPVTFYMDVAGLSSIPEISAASLYFGTEPDIQFTTQTNNNPVPLPPAALLFGSGLIGLVVVARRFKK